MTVLHLEPAPNLPRTQSTLISVAVLDQFAADPVAPHSGQFPLARTAGQAGKLLTMAEPTANKVTSNDGDEGPSEDFTYDYCPDSPLPV